ncbi:MAG TPA: MFS transporter [Planctomycetaceae bacterium]|jgi:ACS family tartrate transporter-like MFS transporter|nr:MFS transporter [Planctomycetaceae bacterium]
MERPDLESSTAKSARVRIAARILPLVFTMYIVNYLDRANVSFAKLPMSEELGFSERVYGQGAGIFFIGYLAFEIPGALIVERFGARRWMARILITWGLCTAAVGMVRTPTQFYGARFLLGLAEAGFFPGIIVYLTHWFAPRDRARAMSGLILAIPIALGLGAPISAAILGINWFGMSGWRWLFILEGLPAVALGIFTFFFMTDRPSQATWLKPEERDWINNELEAERLGKQATERVTVWQAFRQPNVILLSLALFAGNLNSYTFVFWLPTVIKNASGLSIRAATLYSGLPYAAGLIAMLIASYLSDRSGRRKFYTIVPMILTAVLLTVSSLPGQPFWLVMVWLCLAGAAINAGAPSFWVLPTMTLQAAAAAASIGMINSIANLSGYVAPSIVGELLDRGFTHAQIVPFVACCPLVAAGLVAALRVPTTSPARAEPRVP